MNCSRRAHNIDSPFLLSFPWNKKGRGRETGQTNHKGNAAETGGHNPPIPRAKANKEIKLSFQVCSEQHLPMATHHLVFTLARGKITYGSGFSLREFYLALKLILLSGVYFSNLSECSCRKFALFCLIISSLFSFPPSQCCSV